ncbi:cell division regulator GpsB [Lacticaseibacillus parakribbianus]|uniref:cell division regulator GpsB n=1 Tax=Lacticaseibacillus parakribbianus TaxID=2970927 RepID=UPI0021CB8C53|nr:cell division regulator GpsB [Lacticaseibacillus parakribbianus]
MDNNNEATRDVQLDPQAILEKSFKTKMRGYDAAEVDEFLDQVIKDYEAYQGDVDRLEADNARLRSRVDELTKQLNVSSKVAAATPQQPNATVTNYDILKRLSNLERHVFGSKLADGGTKPTDASGIDRY